MTIKQIDVQQLRPGMHVCDAAGTPHGIVTDRYSLNQRMYVTLRTSVDVQHMAPVPFDFQVHVIACPTHDEPLVHEAGGPAIITIHGRTYCPTCQAELLTAMSNSDMIRSGAVDELVADMDRQEFIEKIAGLPKGARARIFEQESRVQRLEDVLRDIAKHGLHADLRPTMMFGDEHRMYNQFSDYLTRLDTSIRSRAQAALDNNPKEN